MIELIDREMERLGTSPNGPFSQLAMKDRLEDLAHRVPIQMGRTGEILLIPPPLLNQPGNPESRIGPFHGGMVVHSVSIVTLEELRSKVR